MPPQISPPDKADDAEVSSCRISPDQPVVRGIVKTRLEGDTLAVRGLGCAAPTGTNNKGHRLFDFRGTAQSATNPEAPDTLMDALRHASVLEDHRSLMGTVVERVQFAKSGLGEAFTSLLRGFEVRNVIFLIVL